MKNHILKILYKIYAFFARIYLKRHYIEIIGITGSVGKTSCRMVVTQILQKYLPEKKIYTAPKNFNSEIGLVLSIFGIEKYRSTVFSMFKLIFILFYKSLFAEKIADILVLEYGVDKPNDMEHLLTIAKPDRGIFTQLDYIHCANFTDKQAIGKEKLKLLKNTKQTCFLNAKDEFQKNLKEEISCKSVFYNLNQIPYKYEIAESRIISYINIGDYQLETNILGEENFMYIELGFLILREMIGDAIEIQDDFLELEKQEGRFSIFLGKNDSVLVDSSYNAGLESMKQMITNVLKLQENVYPEHKLLFVLGDMREIGENSQSVHEKLFEYVKFKGEVVSVGEQTGKYFGSHLGNFKKSNAAGEFVNDYLSNKPDKFLILFKGSQNTIFLEEAIKKVLLDAQDERKLPRQDVYRMKIKNKFLQS